MRQSQNSNTAGSSNAVVFAASVCRPDTWKELHVHSSNLKKSEATACGNRTHGITASAKASTLC